MSDLYAARESHEVLHGYNMGDLDRLARTATQLAWPRSIDVHERYETAWSAISEHLCFASEAPTPRTLVMAGCDAINRLAQDNGRHRGVNRNHPDRGLEGAKNFLKFWELYRRATGSPEDTIVDYLALRQIWPCLSATHRAVLLAMAVHADNALAAQAVGKTYLTFNSHLSQARRRFLALWHEGEAPSRMWGKADRRRSERRTATQLLREREAQRRRRARAAGGVS